jgi:uncharacterized protein YcbK (DUF882 family)
VNRRRFLSTLATAAPLLALPGTVAAAAPDFRALRFRHLHTGERLDVEYVSRGHYVPDALASIDHLLRDFRTQDVHAIDPGLLDLLHALSAATGTRHPFEVISGYRSPATNQSLRSRSQGVASGSLHMVGKAIDIRVGDVRLPALRDAARSLGRGGVGYYPDSDFVHVDTGRVRTW